MKNWRVLGGLALFVLWASLGQAGTITLINGAGQYSCSGITCQDAAWGNVGTINTPVDDGTTLGTGGNTVAISFNPGTGYTAPECSAQPCGLIFVENPGGGPTGTWTGGAAPGYFNNGDSLLSTYDYESTTLNNVVTDSLTLTFTNPISEFVTQIQGFNTQAAWVASITVNGPNNSNDAVGTVNSVNSGSNPAGVNYIGFSDTADIYSVTLDVTYPANSNNYGTDGFFAIDTAYFDDGVNQQGGQTPEPMSLIMIGTGLAAIGWKWRKRA